MRKAIVAFFCTVVLIFTAYAADYTVTRIATDCTAEKSGVCHITQAIDLAVDGDTKEILIPVGTDVSKISLTGANYSVRRRDGASYVALKAKDGFASTLHVDLSYSVQGNVSRSGDVQTFTVTLLDGLWETNIERYSAAMSFPETLTMDPTFSSGYTGEGVGEWLTTKVNGSAVSTLLRGGLKDRESFSVTVKSSEDMFFSRGGSGGNVMRWLMPALTIFLLLAGVAYWFFFLRSRLLHVHARTFPPEAMTPAEAEYVLCSGNIHFSLLLCEWANLGYLTISVVGGKITLTRSMEMGSERREEERKLFDFLFRGSDTCDCSSGRCRRTFELARQTLSSYWSRRLFDRTSGNVQLLRGLAALSCGIALSFTMGNLLDGGLWKWLLVLLAFFAGGFLGWIISLGLARLQIRDWKLPAVAVAALLFLYIMGKAVGTMATVIPAMLLAAFAAWATMHGGKLTGSGGSIIEQLLGYRRYIGHIAAGQLDQMASGDLQTFYRTLLFADAMGLLRRCVAQMAPTPLPKCSWLRVPEKDRTPQQFASLLHKLAKKMEDA